ncbi:hypothetical protein KP509_11G075800 [Ceratopteris richardii]|nr:hypothetical protein KP509_11G075800 [Ceratopteris richardii]
MQPDQWYDSQGVWTGSATFLEDGTLAVLYTGFTNESVQVQNLAFPADPYDPLLRKWNKYVGNPVLLPPTEVQPTDFRDPTTAWLGADGLWRMCIGSKLEGNGIAILYSTSDFINWKIDNHYLHEVEGTGMWECLDFYPVLKNGSPIGISTSRYGAHVKHVLKASMDDSKLDFYVIGTYDHQSHTFTPDDRSVDLGRGHRYDYGKFYASKSFYDDKGERRILWGWINESDSMQNDIRKGWASVQALPRQVWFDADTESNLIQWPVEEVLDLRRSKYSLENMVLQGGTVVEVTGSSGSQWDIEVTFENPISIGNAEHNISDINQLSFCGEGNASGKGLYGPFGLLVLASEGLEEQTAIYFFFTKSNGTWTTLVCSDQSRSSLAINVDKTSYGSVVPVLKKEKLLSLRVIVDHSIVETFVQGGRVCITSRVYPTLALDNAARLFVFNNGTMPIALKSLDAWKVSKVDMHAYATVQ